LVPYYLSRHVGVPGGLSRSGETVTRIRWTGLLRAVSIPSALLSMLLRDPPWTRILISRADPSTARRKLEYGRHRGESTIGAQLTRRHISAILGTEYRGG
jgi:hypothetical protein